MRATSKDNPRSPIQIDAPPKGIARKPVLFFALLILFVIWIGAMFWMWTRLPGPSVH